MARQKSAREIAAAEVVLAEYKALKDEQTKRMGVRDGLPYVALGATIAALGVASRFGPSVLLALPTAAVVLGWTFLANDQKISEIGRYIRTEMGPYVAEHSPAGTLAFGWEAFHRSSRRRRSQKICQLLVDLTAFCATGVGALAGYWAHAAAQPLSIAVTIVEAAVTVGLAFQIVRHAEIGRAAS